MNSPNESNEDNRDIPAAHAQHEFLQTQTATHFDSHQASPVQCYQFKHAVVNNDFSSAESKYILWDKQKHWKNKCQPTTLLIFSLSLLSSRKTGLEFRSVC